MVFRTIVKFSAARRIPLIKFRRQRGEDATASVTSSQQEVGSAASVRFLSPYQFLKTVKIDDTCV